jgi:hypothetical protein
MQLKDIKNNLSLLNAIDWNMTPEEAVRLYLEWGNNWAHGNYVIRSSDDVTHYFVVNTWDEMPVIYFIRRNTEEAVELAEIPLPEHLHDSVGKYKGVYAVEGEFKKWLQNKLCVE